MISKLRQEQSAFTKDIVKLLTFAFERGFEVTLGEAERPLITQKAYVDAGFSKTLKSMHLKRLAVDLHFFKGDVYVNVRDNAKEQLQEIGDYWESLDTKNRWGGNWKNFKDYCHFERFVP